MTESMYFLGLERPTIRTYAIEGTHEAISAPDVHICPQCGSDKIAVAKSTGYLNENGDRGDWEFDCPECHAVVASGLDYDSERDGLNRVWILCEPGTVRDMDGYSLETGRDREGRDRDGYDEEGYDEAGYSRMGYDRRGRDADGLDADGYSVDGHQDGKLGPAGLTHRRATEAPASERA